MQFLPAKNKGPLLLALATLLLIALALAASSLQTLHQQRRAMDGHLLLAARSVHAAMAGALRRRPLQEGELPLVPGAMAFMQELKTESGVHFLGVYSPEGERLFLPLFDEDARRFRLPDRALSLLEEEGEFKGVEPAGTLQLFVYGRDMGPPRLRDRRTPAEPSEMDTPQGPMPPRPPRERRFLVVGLDMSPHLAAYSGFRRSALLQTSLVFLGAAGIWVLGVVLLNRRELARKAVTLERLQSRLLDNLPDGLVHLDGHGGVLAANPAAHVLLGVQEGALVGRNSLALGPQAAALLAGEVETLARPVPWRQQQHGDRFLEVLSLPMEDGSGERLVLLRDRTELNKLEERLSDARRLATVGVLAAGVAHEIRNPLSALRGFAQFFAKKLAGKHPEEQYANTMVSEADRLNRVVGDLLNLARPRVLSPVMVDLQALGDELGRLLEQDFAAAGAVFSTDFQARTCYADADALKQCLLNLVLNSLQAVAGQANTPARAAPEGVTVLPLTVRLGAQASAGDAGSPGNVEVYVEDNGPGMDDAERRHAFDPFYTSKPKGAGLGLALVEKTMREHGGSARMESAPGRGTVVRLLFPLPRQGDMPANPSAEDVA